MQTLSLVRIILLVGSAFVFLILVRRLAGRRIKGLRLVGIGFSLIMLNVFIGSLFQALFFQSSGLNRFSQPLVWSVAISVFPRGSL